MPGSDLPVVPPPAAAGPSASPDEAVAPDEVVASHEASRTSDEASGDDPSLDLASWPPPASDQVRDLPAPADVPPPAEAGRSASPGDAAAEGPAGDDTDDEGAASDGTGGR
jgi:hypothetical protein